MIHNIHRKAFGRPNGQHYLTFIAASALSFIAIMSTLVEYLRAYKQAM